MLKVLIVEDDSSVLSLVRQLVQDEGFAAVTAPDAESAWGTMMTEDPDAAIIDLWLFGVEAGWDLLERIRGNEHFRDLPVVVLTGVSGSDVVERVRAYGAEYVNKPFSPATLLDRLQIVIRRAGRLPGMRSVPVVLLAGAYRIEGTVYIDADLLRFSDAWESIVRDSREFVPVTNARIISADGTATGERELIEVRKSSILAVFPGE